MRGSYSRILRVSDPTPETARPLQFSRTVDKKMTGGECQDLLVQFFRRTDPSYGPIDAEEDFRADIGQALAIARRELFLQSQE